RKRAFCQHGDRNGGAVLRRCGVPYVAARKARGTRNEEDYGYVGSSVGRVADRRRRPRGLRGRRGAGPGRGGRARREPDAVAILLLLHLAHGALVLPALHPVAARSSALRRRLRDDSPEGFGVPDD